FRVVGGPGARPGGDRATGPAPAPAAEAGPENGAESRAGEVRFAHPLRTLPPVPGHVTLRLQLTDEPVQPTEPTEPTEPTADGA
ncbi:hypothetical protein AN220_28100, partial [Streptomyces nanshensis]